MISKRASFQRVKYFYGKGILFGCYGCRWHRYQQSVHPTGIVDRFFFFLLLLVTISLSIWMYFWAVSSVNESNVINTYLYGFTDDYVSWHIIIQAVVGSILVYCSLLTVFGFLHILYGYEVHLHLSHKLLLLLIVGFVIGTITQVTSLYPEGWNLAYISLQVFGLYIQIAVVIFATLLTFFYASIVVNIHNVVTKTMCICFYAFILLALYLSPNYIDSPCVVEDNSIVPAKPKLIAHRGASMYAPENTMAAFELALKDNNVKVIETDIRMSYDQVPFLLHDDTLIRTSNVKDIFPTRWNEKANSFNISELESLDMGSWFLDNDPYNTVNSLSNSQKNSYINQKVVRFSKLLDMVKNSNCSIMFDIQDPTNPFKIIDLISSSGIEANKIWWPSRYGDFSKNYTMITSQYTKDPANLPEYFPIVNYKYSWIDWQYIKDFHDEKKQVILWTVDNEWHFSYWWCANADYVTTNAIFALGNMTNPSMIMKQSTFHWVWISTNFVCGMLVIIIFLFYFYKNAEDSKPHIKHRLSSFRQSKKNMKIGLIGNAEGVQQQDKVGGLVGVESQFSKIADDPSIINNSITIDNVENKKDTLKCSDIYSCEKEEQNGTAFSNKLSNLDQTYMPNPIMLDSLQTK